MFRAACFFLIACWAASAIAAAPAGSRLEHPPNIVVILADDMGLGETSAFGTADIRTPSIDRIIHEGISFNNFYANCPVCSPTRAALLTGCHPDRVGVPGVIREESPPDSWGWLSPSAVLLPSLLKPLGYHSIIVGKWHLGTTAPNIPTQRGFDEFHGFLGDMMDDYYTHRRHGHNFMRDGTKEIDPQGHATDLFTQWACEAIAARARAGGPFFLYLAYNAPHDPVQPKPDWLARVKKREPSMPENRAKLVALIEHMDDGIGQVLAALDKHKLAENTLVMFTSDNGGILRNGANNGPWRSEKQHVYEGGLRVPFAARWPGVIRPGDTHLLPCMTMDIFPTVYEAATGAEAAGPLAEKVPYGIDGISFLPALRGEARPAPERDMYFVRREGGAAYGGKTIEALRRGDWKLLQDSPFAPQELYNLKDDPKEEINLIDKEKKVANDLRAALRRQIQRGATVPWQPPSTK